jgi:large subunit ribosomal protein L31e
MAPRERKPKSAEIVTRDYTIHMSKRLYGITFKKRAPRAIREIKKFALKEMGTKDCRIDASLNKYVWAQGVKGVKSRIRVRLSRRRNDNEDAKEVLYTLCSHVEVTGGAKGLETEIVEE